MNFITGEIFNVDKQSEIKIISSDDEINAKYKRGEVRIVTEQARYPIKGIRAMLESGDYKRNPEYQRRKRWNNAKKSRLIESFIMNVPLPPIFLYEYEYSKYEVMDGLQRLTSIDDFYKNKFELEGLEYWKELTGKTYSQLPSEIKSGIDRRYLSSIILLEETAKTPEEAEQLKQIVFERLNSGGEPINRQETRNALYNGKFNQLCLKLAENEKFRKMWQIPLECEGEEKLLTSEAYRKMEDVQLVLRFFAYRFIDKMPGYTIEEFLDEYLKQANYYSDEAITNLEKLFIDTIDTVYTIFKEEAFLMPKIERKGKKPRKTMYDPLMQSVALNIKSKDNLVKNASTIFYTAFDEELVVGDRRVFDGRSNLQKDVASRIEYFNRLFTQYIL